MPRSIAEIRAVLNEMEHGQHGDGDLRAMGQELRVAFDDAVTSDEGLEGVLDLHRAQVESMKETLEHYLDFLDTEGPHPYLPKGK